MTNRETNFLEMAVTVLAVLKNNLSKFTGITALVNFVTELETGITQVRSRNLAFDNAAKGKTSAKSSAEEELIKFLLPVKGAVYAFASKVKNHELIAIAKINEYELRRIRQSDMMENAEAILKAAETNTAALADYGITPESISNLKAKFQNFENSISDKGQSFSSKSALRQALTDDFDNLEDLLNEQGDHLIELVREKNLDAYNEYFAARVVKDLGGSHGKNENEGGDQNPPANTPTP